MALNDLTWVSSPCLEGLGCHLGVFGEAKGPCYERSLPGRERRRSSIWGPWGKRKAPVFLGWAAGEVSGGCSSVSVWFPVFLGAQHVAGTREVPAKGPSLHALFLRGRWGHWNNTCVPKGHCTAPGAAAPIVWASFPGKAQVGCSSKKRQHGSLGHCPSEVAQQGPSEAVQTWPPWPRAFWPIYQFYFICMSQANGRQEEHWPSPPAWALQPGCV